MKVWCNSNLERTRPDSVIMDYEITEEVMVFDIVKMINTNTNKYGLPFDVSAILLQGN